tara:strand:- start:544 stop:948 length:405 start_codon:yes stop_codon:yes gene_type:complete
MSFPNYKYGTGLSNVGSYQASGKPFAKGSINARADSIAPSVEFPAVTRWIYIVNNDSNNCKVAFSALGLESPANNFFTVKANTTSERLEVKVTEIYLTGSGNVDVLAGLTGIDVNKITNISPSGSNWSGSLGIG